MNMRELSIKRRRTNFGLVAASKVTPTWNQNPNATARALSASSPTMPPAKPATSQRRTKPRNEVYALAKTADRLTFASGQQPRSGLTESPRRSTARTHIRHLPTLPAKQQRGGVRFSAPRVRRRGQASSAPGQQVVHCGYVGVAAANRGDKATQAGESVDVGGEIRVPTALLAPHGHDGCGGSSVADEHNALSAVFGGVNELGKVGLGARERSRAVHSDNMRRNRQYGDEEVPSPQSVAEARLAKSCMDRRRRAGQPRHASRKPATTLRKPATPLTFSRETTLAAPRLL